MEKVHTLELHPRPIASGTWTIFRCHIAKKHPPGDSRVQWLFRPLYGMSVPFRAPGLTTTTSYYTSEHALVDSLLTPAWAWPQQVKERTEPGKWTIWISTAEPKALLHRLLVGAEMPHTVGPNVYTGSSEVRKQHSNYILQSFALSRIHPIKAQAAQCGICPFLHTPNEICARSHSGLHVTISECYPVADLYSSHFTTTMLHPCSES